jgi:D-aminopeptidase
MFLSDVRARPVGSQQVRAAIEGAASGPVPEGALGGGTGMSCFEFKGGIGTASRLTPPEAGGFRVGALVMTNFGRRAHMVIDGVPAGRELANWSPSPPRAGRGESNPDRMDSSIIMVLATDAPLDPRQLERLSLRAGAGLARTGGFFSTTSGDFVIAFSTANRVPHFPSAPVIAQHIVAEGPLENRSDWPIPPINWLFKAETMVGRDGHVRHALPIEETVQIMQRYGHAQVRMPE